MKFGTDLWGQDIGSSGNFSIPTKSLILNNDPMTIDGNLGLTYRVTNTDSLAFAQGAGQGEYLKDSMGYFYVFNGGFTNDEFAVTPTYTKQGYVSTSWSLSINSSTSWVHI